MGAKTFFARAIDNWTAKIVCIAIAIFIYIFHAVLLLDKKVLDVPLEVINEGVLCPTSLIPKSVKVLVRSTSSNLTALSAQGCLKAYIYLSDRTAPDTYNFPVVTEVVASNIDSDPLELTVTPEHIRVSLEERVQCYVPIEPMFYGDVDQNFKIDSVKVSPSEAKVSGPKSIVEAINHVYTKKLNIKGAIKSFSLSTTLDEVSPLVKVDSEVDIRVGITLVTRKGSKTYEKVQLLVQGLAEGLAIESSIPLVSFEIEGVPKVIDPYKLSDKTIVLDCSSITAAGTYKLPVKFNFPQGVILKYVNIKEITIEVVSTVTQEPDAPSEDKNETTEASNEADLEATKAEEGNKGSEADKASEVSKAGEPNKIGKAFEVGKKSKANKVAKSNIANITLFQSGAC